MIRIYSVPHTGTHFVKKLIDDTGHCCKALHYTGFKKTDEPIISPIRHPESVMRTWRARDRDQDFIAVWEIFNQVYKQGGVFVLPIDTDDRHSYLQSLGESLGFVLITDWEKVNEGPQFTGTLSESEKAQIDHVMTLDVVRAFYAKEAINESRSSEASQANTDSDGQTQDAGQPVSGHSERSTETSERGATEEKPKRKRGRPRKEQQLTINELSTDG